MIMNVLREGEDSLVHIHVVRNIVEVRVALAIVVHVQRDCVLDAIFGADPDLPTNVYNNYPRHHLLLILRVEYFVELVLSLIVAPIEFMFWEIGDSARCFAVQRHLLACSAISRFRSPGAVAASLRIYFPPCSISKRNRAPSIVGQGAIVRTVECSQPTKEPRVRAPVPRTQGSKRRTLEREGEDSLAHTHDARNNAEARDALANAAHVQRDCELDAISGADPDLSKRPDPVFRLLLRILLSPEKELCGAGGATTDPVQLRQHMLAGADDLVQPRALDAGLRGGREVGAVDTGAHPVVAAVGLRGSDEPLHDT